MRILQINLVINEQPSSPALLETTRWSADTNIRFDSGSSNKLKNGFKLNPFIRHSRSYYGILTKKMSYSPGIVN